MDKISESVVGVMSFDEFCSKTFTAEFLDEAAEEYALSDVAGKLHVGGDATLAVNDGG